MRKLEYGYVKQYFEEHGCSLISKEYNSIKDKLQYICVCGNESVISFESFKAGSRCLSCGSKSRAMKQTLTYEYVYNYFKENYCTLLSKKYINNSTNLNYICSCGNIDKITFMHFRIGQRCSKCRLIKASASLRFSYEHVRLIFEEENCILISKEYLKSSQMLDYICSCGNASQISLNNFTHGHRCMECSIIKISGTNHYRWRKDLTKADRIVNRSYRGYKEWRTKVLTRDNFKCILCDSEESLNVHHLDAYGIFVDKRLDVINGLTLCKKCHILFHKKYGLGNNTKEQFEEFLLTQNKQYGLL